MSFKERSEQIHNLVKWSLLSLFHLWGTLLVGTVFGRLLWVLWDQATPMQRRAQYIGCLVFILIWLNYTVQEARKEGARRAWFERRAGAQGGEDPTVRLEDHGHASQTSAWWGRGRDRGRGAADGVQRQRPEGRG